MPAGSATVKSLLGPITYDILQSLVGKQSILLISAFEQTKLHKSKKHRQPEQMSHLTLCNIQEKTEQVCVRACLFISHYMQLNAVSTTSKINTCCCYERIS